MTWLDPDQAKAILGDDLASALDDAAYDLFLEGTCEYVESKRRDLYVAAEDPEDPPVFTPTMTLKLGTTMLAYRWYQRRNSATGVLGFTDEGASGILRDDPDIARQLGIGSQGRFVFGAPSVVSS